VPAPDRPQQPAGVARKVTVVGLVLVALLLVAGGALVWSTRPRFVDTAAVEADIGGELSRRLGGTVQVRCPGEPRQEAGVVRCWASDGRGVTREVRVTLLDDDGGYRWELVR